MAEDDRGVARDPHRQNRYVGLSLDTIRALIQHIERYIAHWNDHPTPFMWTKAPVNIITMALRRGRYHDFADGLHSAYELRRRGLIRSITRCIPRRSAPLMTPGNARM